MNAAMELLRARATQLWDQIAGEEGIELLIDPIEEPIEACVTRDPSIVATMSAPKLNAELSKNMTDSNNLHTDMCINQLNLFDMLGRKDKVWIYNISHQEHKLGNAQIKCLKVPACPADEEYAVATSLPLVVVQPKPNVENGETEYFFMDGRRVAMDLINACNLGLDQDRGSYLQWSAVGVDFSKKGVFFSTHNPPLKKELKSAHKRLKVYYQELIDRANIVRITSAAATLGVPTAEVTAAVEYIEGPRSTR